MRISPPKQYTVVEDFKKALEEAHELLLYEDKDVERVVNLRCSQLPYCPVSVLLNLQFQGLTYPMDLMGSYYVSVGHIVHGIFQSHLSRTGKFLADYHCKKCNKWYRFQTYRKCKCGRHTEYHEVLIDHKGIVGHIDAVFQDRNGKYWIVDFKTCSIDNSGKKTVDPGPAYKEQIESYAYLIKKQYGLHIEGVMLCFLPRDNPKKAVFYTRAIDSADLKVIRERLNLYKKLHKQAKVAETAKDVWRIAKNYRCSNTYCKYCTLSEEALMQRIKSAFKRPLLLPLSTLKERMPKPKRLK